MFLTSKGSCGSAIATRFWTSTCAIFGSVPSLNVTVNCMVPSIAETEDMYNMFSTPLTCCSIGSATVSAKVCGSAPGYRACTTTVGGAISGYCATGRTVKAMVPNSTVTTEITIANIGAQ